MTKMLKSLIVLTFIANLSYSQSLQGNVNCVGAIVEYTYVLGRWRVLRIQHTEDHTWLQLHGQVLQQPLLVRVYKNPSVL